MRTQVAIFIMLFGFTAMAGSFSGEPLGCKGKVADFKMMKITSKVLLNKKFLPTDSNPTIQSAIELQLMHLMGFFNNTSDKGLNVALSAYREPAIILNTENIPYGSRLKVDNYLPVKGFQFPVPDYTRQALKRGGAEPADEALLVSYSSNIMIADCSESSFPSNAVVQLPLDPFLSLWLEEASRRNPRQLGTSSIAAASNCSVDEIAEFGQAGLNWFFWSPITLKKNSTEKSLRCKIDSKHLISPTFAVEKVVEKAVRPDKNFFSDKNPLVISAIFGVVSRLEIFSKVDFAAARSMAESMLSQCKKTDNVPACLTVWKPAFTPQSDGKKLEPGAGAFFVYLKYLMTMVKISEYTLENSSEDLILKMSGTFRDSGKPLTLSVFYGKTSFNSKTRVPKTYLKFLHSALKSADSISYFGHAGLGLNLNYSVLTDAFKKDSLPRIKRDKNLWLGIYNCEAFSYFGFDLAPLFGRDRKMLLTETSGLEVGAKFPLAQIEILSRLFVSEKKNTFPIMGKYVATSDFLTSALFAF